MSTLYRIKHWWLQLSGKDRVAIILELAGIGVVLAYTIVNGKMYRETKWENRSQARRFEATQRPYVTIGRADGTVMEWKTLECNKVGIVQIWFQNTGNTIATDFHVWAWLSIGLGWVKLPLSPSEVNHPVHDWPIPHLGPQTRHIETPVSSKIGAHSVWVDYAYSQSVLTERQVNQITDTDIPVSVYGFYEYGDGSGDYWCEPLHAEYASGKGTTILQGFTLSQEPFTKSFCKGHNHHE